MSHNPIHLETVPVKPCLVVLMRSDMASMNPGKGMAQSNHAGSAFADYMEKNYSLDVSIATDAVPFFNMYESWKHQTEQGFGTVSVRDGMDEYTLVDEVSVAQGYGVPAQTIVDPSYPIKDGDMIHHIEIITCAFIFVDLESDYGKDICQRYPLHP